MDLFNPENGDWVQHITWMFSQPEFYPPLIIIGLITMAVLIATFRFIFAKQFLALSVLWLVVIVAAAGLVSFFKTSQQNFEEGVSVSAEGPIRVADMPFSVDPNFIIFGSIAVACLFIFGFSKFRAALSPNLGSRLALEGLVISMLALSGLVLLGARAASVDTQIGETGFALAQYQFPALMTAGWLGIAIVYWGLAALGRKPNAFLSFLQWLAYMAGLVLMFAPTGLSHMSASSLFDMDYQGQFEVWNRISGFGMYCIIGSIVILAALAVLALVRRTR
ncbi:hypothetical protein [Ponticaulis sp.]|uniref:hypothetical protein n=1 Tax=Ponticaulis sp. TaxID=2020902 RepID=UPI00260D2FFB|nr:hypothetical protein [Ponticaulis sp.]MDF1680968.1 hypothetical protein [Ponticaulis sp.]